MLAAGPEYVHGYSLKENIRLQDQATTLAELLHHDTSYPAGCSVLEVGCGVGSQTITLVKNSPQTRFISIDISQPSLDKAERRVRAAGYENATFQKADLFDLPFADNHFDHVFVCFVLEHLKSPVDALHRLMAKMKPGGTITVIEGDHGSAYFHPTSRDAWRTIQCLIDLQAILGGNALIGRQLFPLLTNVGFKNVSVSPRMVYADASKPGYVEGFTKNTFIAMVAGVKDQSLNRGMIDMRTWNKGIEDLKRTVGPDGTFCYTFFKGVGVK